VNKARLIYVMVMAVLLAYYLAALAPLLTSMSDGDPK
jgi:hypothetical protein